MDENSKREIVRLGVKYQVLSQETAFIGVIKQDKKVIGELKKVLIPTITNMQRFSQPVIPHLLHGV